MKASAKAAQSDVVKDAPEDSECAGDMLVVRVSNGLTIAEQKECMSYAAKAMGFNVSCGVAYGKLSYAIKDDDGSIWLPLSLNGDAFSVVTRLCLCLKLCAKEKTTSVLVADVNNTSSSVFIVVDWGFDRDEATRIAILVAAAEIGKRIGGATK